MSLASKFPKIAKEWHPTKNKDLTPNEVAPYSSKKAHWVCERGHVWATVISSRTLRNTGCPECFKQRQRLLKTGYSSKATPKNNLQVSYPGVAKEWHPTKNKDISPKEIAPYSSKKAHWLCEKGHEWEVPVFSRTRSKTKCPYCLGRKPSSKHNLSYKFRKISKEWHPTKNKQITPKDVTPSSSKEVYWLCDKGHVWWASVNNRTNHKTKCPACTVLALRKKI